MPANPRKRRASPGLLVMLLLGMAAAVVVLNYDIFIVRTVEVVGNQIFSAQDVTDLAGIAIEENIFLVDTDAVTKRISTNPYIVVERVERVLPNRVRIRVRERQPRAAVRYLDAFAMVDREGIVLEVRDSLGTVSAPVVLGLVPTSFKPGQALECEDQRQAKVLRDVLSQMTDKDVLGMIGEIGLAEPDNITMLSREGISIAVGSPDGLDKKMLWVRNVLPVLREQGIVSGTLDVTSSTNASYRPPAAPSPEVTQDEDPPPTDDPPPTGDAQ